MGKIGYFRALCILLICLSRAEGGDIVLAGRVQDGRSGEALEGVSVRIRRAEEPERERWKGCSTDSAGGFRIGGVAPGEYLLEAERLGYLPFRRKLEVEGEMVDLDIRLQPQPLLMEGIVARARREDGGERTPAFVEQIPVQEAKVGLSLPELLDQAVGIEVRRHGGMGSFSTVSIRGSTSEQVQIYLDGIPLNQALGGGVDLGGLPLSGVERVEVFRGAIPARLGGNSIGGVIQIRTRRPDGARRVRFQASAGSFGFRQVSGSAGGST